MHTRRLTAAASAGLILALWLTGPHALVGGDTPRYLQMASGGATPVPSPWAYRLAVPLLLRTLPVDPAIGFVLITLLSTWASALGCAAWARGTGASARAAMYCALGVLTMFPMLFYLNSTGWVDPPATAFGIWAVVWARRRALGRALLLLAAGVACKETTLLFAPVVAAALWNTASRLRVVAGLVLVVGVWVAPRVWVHPAAGPWDVRGLAGMRTAWATIWPYNTAEQGFLYRLVREPLRAFGVLGLCAVLGWRGARGRRLDDLYLLACGPMLCLLATDWSRLVGWGFPGVLAGLAHGVDRIGRAPHGARHLAGMLGCAMVAAAWTPDRDPAHRTVAVAVSLAAAGAGVIWTLVAWRAASRPVA